ncbi:MAG: hypothetical protein ACYDEX_12610 [Mobilitalea sp.]
MRKIFIVVSILLCFTLLFNGCGGSVEPTDSEDGDEAEAEGDTETDLETEDEDIEEEASESEESQEGEEVISEGVAVEGDKDYQMISDLAGYWNDLYTANEAVLNAYEGMPIMETVTPGLCFISGAGYDLLNLENADGRFVGDLMLSGYKGFVEKNGGQFTFGYEGVLEEDGFGPSNKKGDKHVENGNCDLNKGYFYADNYSDRAGSIIVRSTSVFQKHEDGSMSTIVIDGRTQNYNGDAEPVTSYIFIRNGKNQYDLIVAKSTTGTNYEPLAIEADMTKEMAVAKFEAVGAIVEISAGIKDGAFVLE